MKSKFLSALIYVIFGSVALIAIANSQEGSVWNAVKIAGFALIGLCVLSCFIIFLYCLFDNKKINKMLNEDDYKSLYEYVSKQNKKNLFFMKERHRYYKYLLLLCNLENDLDSNIIKGFEEFNENDLFIYPVVYYWKACFEFSKKNYSNIESLYQSFVTANDVRKRPNVYNNLGLVFKCLYLCNKKELTSLRETYGIVDWNKVTIPSTKRCKEYIDNMLKTIEN